jgi:hypothetical protein
MVGAGGRDGKGEFSRTLREAYTALAERATRQQTPRRLAAVPEKLVGSVVIPLRRLVIADAEATKLFSEWALFHGSRRDEKPGILAIYQSRIDETLGDDEQAAQEDEIPPGCRGQVPLHRGGPAG